MHACTSPRVCMRVRRISPYLSVSLLVYACDVECVPSVSSVLEVHQCVAASRVANII
jgi:hypothetical protein